MKNSEKSSNKKLTIINFEKLKGMNYPESITPNSFIFKIVVDDLSDDLINYIVHIKYGSDILTETYIKILRELTHSPRGFDGYRVDVSMPNYTATTHFTLSSFQTPTKFLKELSSFIKKEIETLPF
jgi:hypothetical protein